MCLSRAIGSRPVQPAITACWIGSVRGTQEDSIEACGEDSSGEVEFILIGWQGRTFVGLASDHTDRKVDVTVSKQMCDKPNRLHAVVEDVIGHWTR